MVSQAFVAQAVALHRRCLSRSLPLVERGGLERSTHSRMESSGVQVVPGGNLEEEARLEVPWFASPVYTEEEVEMYSLGAKEAKSGVKSTEPILPEDPRLWSRADVCEWVAWMCRSHSLPRPNTERFLMNGKAVCLMSVTMFTSRVPLGGKLLYRDFQIRLASALHKKV